MGDLEFRPRYACCCRPRYGVLCAWVDDVNHGMQDLAYRDMPPDLLGIEAIPGMLFRTYCGMLEVVHLEIFDSRFEVVVPRGVRDSSERLS